MSEKVFALQREIARMAEVGVWNGKPPDDEQAAYDRGFRAACGHIALELSARLVTFEGQPLPPPAVTREDPT